MTEAAEAVGYSLAENYIYTTEAVIDYWRALDEDGRLAFILHDRRDLARMLNTVVQALSSAGIPRAEIAGRIVIASPARRRLP